MTTLNPAEQAAIAKAVAAGVTVDGQPIVAPAVAPAVIPQRPADVPEKFWDAEKGVVRHDDVLKGYVELEKKQAAPAAKPTESAAKTPEQLAAEAAAAAAAPKAPAFDALFDKASAEYAEKGALAPETYAALAAAGAPAAVVDNYIAGQIAVTERLYAQAHSIAGGEAEFAALTAWAATNLTPGEVAAFNAQVGAGLDASRAAVSGLKARYDIAVGKEGTLIAGGGGQGTDVYASKAEMIEAMRDPKYRTDEAYRLTVAQKVSRSNAAGTLGVTMRDVTARRA